MRWHFSKFAGCGNDFILFDNRLDNFPHDHPQLLKQLCHRQRGIGGDGILLLETSDRADCRMRIFNSDGSEAEMCGNGLRCFVRWLPTMGFDQKNTFQIEVSNHLYRATDDGTTIHIDMGQPVDVEWDIPIDFEDLQLTIHHLNTGVPHAVVFVDNIDKAPLMKLGQFLRHHPRWAPRGTNVTIAQVISTQSLKVRTYERGVEGETLACGTGAVAAALAAAYQWGLWGPIQVETRSSESLAVNFDRQGKERFTEISLSGSAEYIFSGEIEINAFSPLFGCT